MPKENDSSVLESEQQPTPATEQPQSDAAQETEEKTEEVKGLSRRDALEVAIAATKEADKEDSAEPKSKPQVFKAPKEERKTKAAPDKAESPVSPKYQPPGEWTREEREDFLSLSEKQQQAALRLHKSRQSTLEQIKTAAREHEGLKQLSESVNPYLKALGVKEPSEVALKKALKMWREFEEGDPKAAAAAYLKAKGLQVPKELLTEQTQQRFSDEKITPLQQRLEALEQTVAQEKTTKARSVLGNAWAVFESEKNAVGAPKYPDIDNTDTGLRLAKNIGSLVRGDTPLSQQFIAKVRERIPGASMSTLIREAYRFEGGRVDDSEAPRTQTTQSHIQKSSRAAASVPPSGVRSANSNGVKRFADRREALAAAIADLNQE